MGGATPATTRLPQVGVASFFIGCALTRRNPSRGRGQLPALHVWHSRPVRSLCNLADPSHVLFDPGIRCGRYEAKRDAGVDISCVDVVLNAGAVLAGWVLGISTDGDAYDLGRPVSHSRRRL